MSPNLVTPSDAGRGVPSPSTFHTPPEDCMKKIVVGRSAYTTGPLLKWSEQAVGFKLEGTILGFRQGKFGPLCDLMTAGGPVTAPCPTALEPDLRRVRVGAPVCIEYRGREINPRTNHTFHAFAVSVDREEDLLPAGIEAELATLRVEPVPVGETKKGPAW
jgi:hypothetical protein